MWFFGIFKFFWYQWTSLYERKCESTEGFEWRMMGAYGEREVFKELFCEASAPAKSSFARQPPALSCEPLSLTHRHFPANCFVLSFTHRHFPANRL
jgi:hypothetical protein